MATVQKRTVLITGSSTGGIRWAMAKVLHAWGFHVFATARDPSKAADLLELGDDVEVLELDVTVPQTISECRDAVAKRTGGRLDVLVNNAGVEFIRPLLDVDIAEAKRLYDVNVWEPLAVVHAFSSLLIEARGVVANQSSIDAVLSMAWAGIFSSSKAAVTCMSEILRLELEPLGEAAYKERMDHQSKASDAGVLAEKLVKDVLSGNSEAIWHGAFAPLLRFITWAFPTWYVDKLVNADRGLDQVRT
ncbi:hypothetical protein BX600DRAFT_555991 [Xylariales sp. PMI_506]|nr:hypothetical protein BX600DRAFT_555991 [Xylariales sp. PMI_506]